MAEIWAARKDDELIHTSALADIASAVAEVAVYAVATAAVSAAAAAAAPALAGVAVLGAAATAASGCVGAGLIVGFATSLTGVGEHISNGCDAVANWLFPPSVSGVILTGSPTSSPTPNRRHAPQVVYSRPQRSKRYRRHSRRKASGIMAPSCWPPAVISSRSYGSPASPAPASPANRWKKIKSAATNTRFRNTWRKAPVKYLSTANRPYAAMTVQPARRKSRPTSPKMCRSAAARWWYATSRAASCRVSVWR